MATISERTSLGYVLQRVVDEALKLAGIRYLSNHQYHEYFIRPDALIPGVPPTHSVHVTATGTDDSFRMKKWRYVDEILQMRSVWRNSFVAINVMFGPLSGYQRADLRLIEHLFDHDIIVEQLPYGSEMYQKAIDLVESNASGLSSTKIVNILLEDQTCALTIAGLSTEIVSILRTVAVSKADTGAATLLSNYYSERQSALSKCPVNSVAKAYWKRTILRFFAVPPSMWEYVISLRGRYIEAKDIDPSQLVTLQRAKLVVHHKEIVDKVVLHKEVATTIDAGLDLAFLSSLLSKVSSDPRRKFELADLWDYRVRATEGVREVVLHLEKGREALTTLVTYSLKHGGSPSLEHHRSHVVDVLIAAVGWSQNRLQSKYTGPGIGVSDPIRNLVPRTELAVQTLRRGTVDPSEIAGSITDVIWDAVINVNWTDISSLVDKYIDYRVYCLTKGSSIDPLADFVNDTLESSQWKLVKPNVTCVHPLTGRTKTRFTAVGTKRQLRILVKCLFGDSGADHKAEEMEARMRIIRTCENPWKDSIAVFVADGNWSSRHIAALRLGGWDHVVPVNELEALLKSFF